MTAQPITNVSEEIFERGLVLSIPVVSDPAFALCKEYAAMGVPLVMEDTTVCVKGSLSEVKLDMSLHTLGVLGC